MCGLVNSLCGDPGRMMTLIALIVLTYLAFVFFSESLNPFAKPQLHSNRSNWRYGRRMAVAVFIGSICTFVLLDVATMALPSAIGIGGAIAFLLGLCISAKKIGNAFRQ